jgi:hypothetical protein
LGRFPRQNRSLSSLQIGKASQVFTARVLRLDLEGDYSRDFSSQVVQFLAFGKRGFSARLSSGKTMPFPSTKSHPKTAAKSTWLIMRVRGRTWGTR